MTKSKTIKIKKRGVLKVVVRGYSELEFEKFGYCFKRHSIALVFVQGGCHETLIHEFHTL